MFFDKRQTAWLATDYRSVDGQRQTIAVSLQALLLLLLLTSFAGEAIADEFELSVAPNKCISLRRGQTCFQRLEFRWQAALPTRICLWRDGDETALNCWHNESSGRFRYKFAAQKTTGFYLRAGESTQQVLARTEVKITWVYNSRSTGRTRWRLF